MIRRDITNILMKKQQSYYTLRRHSPLGVIPEWNTTLALPRKRELLTMKLVPHNLL